MSQETTALRSRVERGRVAQFVVRPFEEAEQLWNQALATLPGATLYHRPKWLALFAPKLWIAALGRDAGTR